MNEVFRIIPGYEPYEISNLGHLRRNGVILSTPVARIGYKRKYLKDIKKNLLIHRAIAMAFIPNPENKKEVNHIDGNKQNNAIKNLEWASRKENAQHAYRIGLMHDQRGEKSHRAKLKEHDIKIIREAASIGFSQTQIANYLKLDPSTINLIVRRVNWVNV